jgi:hypothetical protein
MLLQIQREKHRSDGSLLDGLRCVDENVCNVNTVQSLHRCNPLEQIGTTHEQTGLLQGIVKILSMSTSNSRHGGSLFSDVQLTDNLPALCLLDELVVGNGRISAENADQTAVDPQPLCDGPRVHLSCTEN